MTTPTLPAPMLSRLAAEFPADFLSTDPAELAEFGRDWTRIDEPRPCALALPRTTDEVSRLMKLCTEFDVPVVPSGGRTGLAGGAVAARGELVVSLSRMRRIDGVDLLGRTMRVQAGAITEAVHQAAEQHGLTWPVDFASKGSSQVGGNIATNAGGVRVIRYGLTRQWVLGLQVVLASGEVLEIGGALEKNNTGADLRQLFIGTEGTLGIVTEATLKLARLPERVDVLLFAVEGLPQVLSLFRATQAGPFTVRAFEFFTSRCLARLQRHRSVRPPFEGTADHYVLIEVEDAASDGLDAWTSSLFEEGLVVDGTLARNAQEASELWTLREGISESLSATGMPHKNDIALPIAALEPFCNRLEDAFTRLYPDWEICLFGHIGDGNLHVNVMKPDAMEKAEFLRHTHDADRILFDLVREYAGSISAEHGIGLLKKPWLSWSRSAAELEVLRGLKRTLDPKGLLNPGKILDV